MSPSENEDDAKKTRLRPEPLCLFCFPEDTPFSRGKTYVDTPKEEPAVRTNFRPEEPSRRFPQDVRQKEKEEFWLRKRTEARIRRRRMKEPIRNLRSYLLTSVKNEKSAAKANLPSLFEVLETVKDAWPSPSTRSKSLLRNENLSLNQYQSNTKSQSKMKDEKIGVQLRSQLLNRRLSVPEELMRKYSVSKEKTSEESETNKTAIEISPSSSSTIETARWKGTDEPKPKAERANAKLPPKVEEVTTDARQQVNSSEEAKPRKTDLPQRVTQNDYYKQGKRIIKVKAVDEGTCTCTCEREPQSSTTVSAKDETDDSGTTESLLSSPTQLPKRESSSGNLSSESDNIRCTCAELSSMETSADLYLSGKSTLSQTVSDKSMSTQDSTVSVNSVSSRGSTVSDNSNSTTPEIERTSAKETTTSPDYSPRTPRNRKHRRRDHLPCYQPSKSCPRHNDAKHSRNYLGGGHGCPIHSHTHAQESRTVADAATNTCGEEDTRLREREATRGATAERSQNERTANNQPIGAEMPAAAEERYKWAKLSQEELYMMQQLRHRRFIESQRKLSSNLPPLPDSDSIISCGSGSAYKETEQIEQPIMIPRYSALPRSLSMLVNTSSPETSHNSDSDNQSLADSLEDQPVTHVHKLYFDTKKESKPVRGDASTMQDGKLKHRQPRGRAFFVSLKQPYGEDEMLENIEKIPQPPEKIKNQIFKRHLTLCAKHKHLHHPEEQKDKKNTSQRSKKTKNKSDDNERVSKTRKEENRKVERRITSIPSEKSKRKADDAAKSEKTEMGTKKEEKEGKKRFGSKIPVLVTSRSTSSSPDGEPEKKEKLARPKAGLRRDMAAGSSNPHPDMETTQVLQIMHKGTELSLQKPQAVIHPSQVPLEFKADPPLVIPPLVSTLKIPTFRQTWNKQLLAPLRRSPIGKFRQRFEVIPEEKSSSLSSAEEKNGKESGSKFADASTSPVPSENIHFQSYNVNDVPNLIVAKIANKPLETLPSVSSSESQKIILFSSGSQNSNSSKGRDALIAMNREDFNRLAKGWMNFYKLNENLDNSETEGRSRDNPEEKPDADADAKLSKGEDILSSKEKKSASHSVREPKDPKPPDLDENVRFDSSNTILRTTKPIPPPQPKKQSTLPELRLHKTSCSQEGKSWPPVGRHAEDDETDSDSTDYMEPPSPRVPPLPIGDVPSDATLSSGDSELDEPKSQVTTQSLKRRSTTNRSRLRNPSEISRCGKKKNSGWSVTVAGTVELSRSAPDLEMRLSFPAGAGPPVVSQSDSGFAEESNYSKLSESLQELDLYTLRKEPPSGQRNAKQKWMVTVKNPKAEDVEESHKQPPNHHLPDLEPTQGRKSKKVLKKNGRVQEKMKRLVERKMRAIWPEVQKVIQREFLTESGRLMLDDDPDAGSCLSVRGSAVSLERKQKPPTMTERDVTRRYTSRTE